jgi:SNF2 family DNA or RNA helicase
MNLKTELLPHQIPAVNKIRPSKIAGLFMEMGTGKTRTAFELVYLRQGRFDKVVYFCPVSLKETVRQEILKHTDCTDIYVFSDKTTEENLPAALWYIIGIESMSSSIRIILAARKLITAKTFVILDESSYIKGAYSMRTMRITELCKDAKYRLILTGTPLSQGVVDLFAQMRFLSPKILGYNSFYSFAANHLEYSEKYPGMIVRSHNTEFLAAKISPYVYQVTKDECLDLPSKLYTARYFHLTDVQAHYYDLAKEEIISQIDDHDITSIFIFRLFSVLQGIVCGFWNRKYKDKATGTEKVKKIEFEHNRVTTLLNMINSIPDDKKIIIWCKYQYDIEQIKQELEIVYGKDCVAPFYGALNEKERSRQVENFRNGARFFLATQSCGGHGLTLNEAHYVIFYNNAFKYSERLQAEDRCHRIGQEEKVTYIDLHCVDTIDDRIEKALSKKGSLVAEFKNEIDKVKDKKTKLKELIKAL